MSMSKRMSSPMPRPCHHFILLISYFLLAAATVTARPPNVVLIMADDMGWETVGTYRGEDYDTPNLDRLAAEGMRFDHAYSTPICTPSRVMLMTGKYNYRNYTHFGRLASSEHTIGHVMQEAGYRTAIAGKWQLNGIHYPELFSDAHDSMRPMRFGFDEACLWQVTKHKQQRLGGGERFWSPPLEVNGKMVTVEENADLYGPDIMSGFLLDFMSRHRDEPFFVYYPSNLVHDPFVPTPDTIGDAPRDQSANAEPKDPVAKKTNFVAMVEYLDQIVGRFVDRLEEIGQLDNTLIIFTADNGTSIKITSNWNGREIQGGKASQTDMGTHVPFIAYWRGTITPGTITDELVDFTDIYPTLADLTGQKVAFPETIDGRSLVPVLKGEPAEPKVFVMSHYQPYWGGGKFRTEVFARTTDHKLYGDGSFFDMSRDLDEANDLSANLSTSEESVRAFLQGIIDQTPEVPADDSGRPIVPYWPRLEPGD